MMTKYGKYKAIVIDNSDPQNRGRVRVKCPKIYGKSLSPWCEACLPFISSSGIDIQIPSNGDQVWIEFEQGKVDSPIYVGSWLNSGQVDGAVYRTCQFNSINSNSITVNGVRVALITDIK